MRLHCLCVRDLSAVILYTDPPIPIPPRPYGSEAVGSSEDAPSRPQRKKRGTTPPAPPTPYAVSAVQLTICCVSMQYVAIC